MNHIDFKDTLNTKSFKLAISCLLAILLLSQLAVIHPVAAITSETVKLQPLSAVTVSNIDSVKSGITVGRQSGLSWIAYMTFDLSSIPKDADIQSINLKVYSSAFTKANFVTVHSVSSDWTESTINWDNRPTDDKLLGSEWIDLFFEWYTWDFTNWGVETQNNKLSISMELSTGMAGYIEFASKDSSSAPYLEITYTLPDPTPTPTIYEPIDYILPLIVLIAIIAVISFIGVMVFRKMFPKKQKYQPPPPPNNSLVYCILFNTRMKQLF